MEWDICLFVLFCFLFSGYWFHYCIAVNVFLKFLKMDLFTISFFRIHVGVKFVNTVLVFKWEINKCLNLEQLIWAWIFLFPNDI